jgi:deoxyribonuclease V
MRIYELHRWNLSYQKAVALQIELRNSVRLKPLALSRVRFVAGVDIGISKLNQRLISAAAVYEFPSLKLTETRSAVTNLSFPYIPGLLSFREIPALVACLKRVASRVDVVLCDGHGLAHPRGLGLASHLGLLLRKPTIGCAKSLLCGQYEEVGVRRGDFSRLLHNGKRVGSVLRTREGVKPVFVSPGHLTDQASSRRIVLACATQFRLPEPTRRADQLAAIEKRRLESTVIRSGG